MDKCCNDIAGSEAKTLKNCYPYCHIVPKAGAGDTSPPSVDDTIDKFYQCLVGGDNGTIPQGLRCSSVMQKRGEDSAGSRTSAKSKAVAAGVVVLVMAAMLQ